MDNLWITRGSPVDIFLAWCSSVQPTRWLTCDDPPVLCSNATIRAFGWARRNAGPGGLMVEGAHALGPGGPEAYEGPSSTSHETMKGAAMTAEWDLTPVACERCGVVLPADLTPDQEDTPWTCWCCSETLCERCWARRHVSLLG